MHDSPRTMRRAVADAVGLCILQLILVLDADLTRHLSTVSETQAVPDGECGEDSASSVQ